MDEWKEWHKKMHLIETMNNHKVNLRKHSSPCHLNVECSFVCMSKRVCADLTSSDLTSASSPLLASPRSGKKCATWWGAGVTVPQRDAIQMGKEYAFLLPKSPRPTFFFRGARRQRRHERRSISCVWRAPRVPISSVWREVHTGEDTVSTTWHLQKGLLQHESKRSTAASVPEKASKSLSTGPAWMREVYLCTLAFNRDNVRKVIGHLLGHISNVCDIWNMLLGRHVLINCKKINK